jgi:hypothetical protein
MKREGSYLVIAIIIALGVVALYYWGGGPTGFAISEVQSNFSEGEVSGLVINEDGALVLDNTTSGTYTSGIFDAGESTSWNSITSVESVPDTIDNSVINESGWINSTGYILSGFDSSWSEITLTALYNSIDNSPIELGNATLDSSGVVTNATDTEFENALISYDYLTPFNSSLSFQARVSDDSNFTNSSFEPVEDLDNLGLQGRYFQFIVVFESSDPEISPSLTSVSVEYGEADPIIGCTDSEAENYNPDATEDDGDCSYSQEDEDDEEETAAEVGPVAPQLTRSLSSSDLGSVSLGPGESSGATWTITNTGEGTLIQCLLSASGDASPWISVSSVPQNVAPGGEEDFALTVNVPGDAAAGAYTATISIACFDVSSAKDIIVNVVATEEEPVAAEGAAPTAGFAIFGEDGIGTGGFVVLIVVVLALVFLFVASRRMRRQGKTIKDLGASIRGLFKKRAE